MTPLLLISRPFALWRRVGLMTMGPASAGAILLPMSADGEDFGRWLRDKLLERHMSLAQLCRQAGCDYTYLWRIINSDTARGRRYTRPSYPLTRKIGDALEASREALVAAGYGDGEELEAAREADRRSRLERDVSRIQASPEGQGAPPPAEWGTRRLPLLGHIQAGDLHEALENPDEYYTLPDWIAASATFVLKVRGDSMAPTLLDGDIVAVREQPTADLGQLIVVQKGEEATVKRFEMQDGVPTAVADNPAFEGFTLGPRARIAGVVVGSYRPPEVLLRRPR